jgi:hypothetical protein
MRASVDLRAGRATADVSGVFAPRTGLAYEAEARPNLALPADTHKGKAQANLDPLLIGWKYPYAWALTSQGTMV